MRQLRLELILAVFQMPDVDFKEIITEYKEEMFGCGQTSSSSGPLVACSAVPLADIELR